MPVANNYADAGVEWNGNGNSQKEHSDQKHQLESAVCVSPGSAPDICVIMASYLTTVNSRFLMQKGADNSMLVIVF